MMLMRKDKKLKITITDQSGHRLTRSQSTSSKLSMQSIIYRSGLIYKLKHKTKTITNVYLIYDWEKGNCMEEL